MHLFSYSYLYELLPQIIRILILIYYSITLDCITNSYQIEERILSTKMIDPSIEPEFSVAERSEHYRSQNYRKDWEKLPGLGAWLQQGKNQKRARCVICDVEMTADICVIKSHGKGVRHNKRLLGDPMDSDLKCSSGHYNTKWEKDPEYNSWLRKGRLDSKAECSLCDVEFRAEKTVLRNHAKSKRHARAQCEYFDSF